MDDFTNYFEVSLDVFKAIRFYENTEFFIDNASQGRIGIVAYDNSKDHRLFISIEVDFSLERNEIEISSLNNFHLIRHYRNNATKLNRETFEYLYGETIKFIDDHHNYIINSDNLIKLFKQASEGKLTTIELIYSEFDLSPIINALNEQIREIKYRLMHNDNDRKASREKLRGMIEGLKRGISEIKRFVVQLPNEIN